MDVLKIHKNGFKDLVCITPPGCKLSSSSNIRSSDRGKAPGILTQMENGSGIHGFLRVQMVQN